MSSDLILSGLKAAVAGAGGAIPFSEFMRIALYQPEAGYYRRARERIGFGASTDFFTATSTGGVFGELVLEGCCRLLAPEKPGDFCFVEVGAEAGGGVLPEKHPFAERRILRHGEPMEIPERAFVFSNELFDAQPFHRLIFTGGRWREIGVDWREGPVEALLPELSAAVEAAIHRLPRTAGDGYHLDLPLEADALLQKMIDASAWRGALIIFDYGKSWRELIEATPQGTARAYRRHRQTNDLLADPGEQDLTCHICWDWLRETLGKNGFQELFLQSQESFFIRNAATAIEAIVADRPGQLDPRRQALQQLIHPANMGQKFQVLTGKR